jgi:hypothetical protein
MILKTFSFLTKPSYILVWIGANVDIRLSHFEEKHVKQLILMNATLQNFIYKHTQDLENVQRLRKKGKGKIYKMSN